MRSASALKGAIFQPLGEGQTRMRRREEGRPTPAPKGEEWGGMEQMKHCTHHLTTTTTTTNEEEIGNILLLLLLPFTCRTEDKTPTAVCPTSVSKRVCVLLRRGGGEGDLLWWLMCLSSLVARV